MTSPLDPFGDAGRATIPFSAFALATAAALVIATPAAAAPFTSTDVTVYGTTWSIVDFETGFEPYLEEADREDWFGNNDTFDSGLKPVFLPLGETDLTQWGYLECASDGDLSPASDGSGDQIATCDVDAFASGDGMLDARYELRFFADGETVRGRLIISNESASTVSGSHVGFRDNYYQDDDTCLGASTTAVHPAASDAAVVDGDLLWIIYDSIQEDDYEVPVVLTAAGTADATVAPVISEAAGNGNDLQVTLYPLPALAPGKTVEIVQFWVWNFFAFDQAQLLPDSTPIDETQAASSEANTETESLTVEVVTEEGLVKNSFLEPAALFVPSALAAVEESWDARPRFASLSTRDAAGIADPSLVLNWKLAAENNLADTGPGDLVPFASFAALLLIVGAGIVVVRRRSAKA